MYTLRRPCSAALLLSNNAVSVTDTPGFIRIRTRLPSAVPAHGYGFPARVPGLGGRRFASSGAASKPTGFATLRGSLTTRVVAAVRR